MGSSSLIHQAMPLVFGIAIGGWGFYQLKLGRVLDRGFYSPFPRWRNRQDDPRAFWSVIVVDWMLSLVFVGFGLWSFLQHQLKP
jgi:hypothetical protein